MRDMWMLGACCLLAGCVSLQMPVQKRALTGAAAVPVAAVDEVRSSEPMPVVDCGTALSQDQDLRRSVIEQLVDNGDYYAALAQVETLPRRAASVGLLRASILRQLDPVESERWYRALLGSCLSGYAEHGLGLIDASRGHYQQARARLQVAASAYPADPRIRNDLGVVYLHLRDDPRAAFELRTAHELAKDDAQPRFNLMLLALLQSDRTGWQDLRGRWQPEVPVLTELRVACQRLQSVRQVGSPGGMATCPLDPLL